MAKRLEIDRWVLEIDDEAGAVYLYTNGVIPDGGVAFTRSVNNDKVGGQVNVDYGFNNEMLGVEIIL